MRTEFFTSVRDALQALGVFEAMPAKLDARLGTTGLPVSSRDLSRCAGITGSKSRSGIDRSFYGSGLNFNSPRPLRAILIVGLERRQLNRQAFGCRTIFVLALQHVSECCDSALPNAADCFTLLWRIELGARLLLIPLRLNAIPATFPFRSCAF